MEENEDIKFNLTQFQRHRKSYTYLIRIAIYIIILIFLTLLIRNKFNKIDSSESEVEMQDVEIDIIE